jgi:hypothetical protein
MKKLRILPVFSLALLIFLTRSNLAWSIPVEITSTEPEQTEEDQEIRDLLSRTEVLLRTSNSNPLRMERSCSLGDILAPARTVAPISRRFSSNSLFECPKFQVKKIGIKARCPKCFACFSGSGETEDHSRQHFTQQEIRSYNDAIKFAREDVPTSVLNHAGGYESVLQALTQIQPKLIENHPLENSFSQAFDTQLSFKGETDAAGDYQFRLIVCKRPRCANNMGKNIRREGAFQRGEVISLFPICGPRVIKVRDKRRLNNLRQKHNAAVKFPTPGLGVDLVPCVQASGVAPGKN